MDPLSFAVGAVPADPDLFIGAPLARSVMHEGRPAFEFTGLSGPVRLELRRALPGWYLKSAFIDGIDAADYPVAPGPASRDREIEVVVARGGGLSGEAVDDRGMAASHYAVVVFPVDASRWYPRSRWLKLARADASGRFGVDGLPPGDYYAVAVDWIPGDELEGEWQMPAMLGALLPSGQRVRVTEGNPLSLRLRLMRMP